MSTKRRTRKPVAVEAATHSSAKRLNIPTAEDESLVADDDRQPRPVRYPRNTDLDPQLVWRGKDEQDWSDLVVPAPPLYIQEKVEPKALVDDLLRETKARRDEENPPQPSLFADFNGLPEDAERTEFYQHQGNWSNRMILGDSLRVMASLAEREGLRGKVQCIYLDPPYGIKFNSNFPVVHDEPGCERREAGAHQPRAGAGEGVPGYLARRDSLVPDVSPRPADGCA